MSESSTTNKVRYAVVGLGHISQIAVLPAFQHASSNSELTALISNDEEKIVELKEKYGVKHAWSYDRYEEALKSGTFDAVYIALPNDMHKEYTLKAAKAGIHVLCEKPMALDTQECKEMISACEKAGVKLMIAYRLHFDQANMQVVDLIQKGVIGDVKVFSSTFSLQVKDGNIRTRKEKGGGPLMDIGIYCINAARYVMRGEPIEVAAFSAKSTDPRFSEVEEVVAAVMRFSDSKVATFVCSFAAADESTFKVVGTDGAITMSPCYDYAVPLKMRVETADKTEEHEFGQHDQFAPELTHFSRCVLEDKDPEPSGLEGLADMRVIEALNESASSGKAVKLGVMKEKPSLPGPELIEVNPAIEKPDIINAESGSQ